MKYKRSIADQQDQLSRRACIVATAVAGLVAAIGMPAHAAALAKGDLVEWPPLDLLDGRRLEPAAWKGRAAVIVFWSVDCAYCKRHNARLEKLHQSIRARGSDLQILAIATDNDPELVRSFLRDKDYHFPVAIDRGGIRASLTDRRVIPMTVLIDRQGRLLLAIPGEMSEDDLLGLGKQLG